MLFSKIHPKNPDARKINEIVALIQKGKIVILPTDSVYSICCDLNNHKAIQRVAQLKGIRPEKANFSVICNSLSQVAEYTTQILDRHFKIIRKCFPGPYTFIFNAGKKIPGLFQTKKKTVGIRIPNNTILMEIIDRLGNPLVSTSVHDDDEIIEYTTDPELIYEKYRNKVDAVVDGGYGNNVASTVVGLTGDSPELIRQGIGEIIIE